MNLTGCTACDLLGLKLLASEGVNLAATRLDQQFVTGHNWRGQEAGAIHFLLSHKTAIGGIDPMQITFGIADDQVAVIQRWCSQVTV
ncbi:hypothetical protein D3C75_1216340 [compost metagenome]